MLNIAPATRIFLVLGATDMRKAIDGLSLLVSGFSEVNVLDGALFVFCNRSCSMIKILYWERNGFCLWQKRLEKHRFIWPKHCKDLHSIDSRMLSWLLSGLDIENLCPHPELSYKNVF